MAVALYLAARGGRHHTRKASTRRPAGVLRRAAASTADVLRGRLRKRGRAF